MLFIACGFDMAMWIGSYYGCFVKQKTAYEMRISDWSADVCSSDLRGRQRESEARKLDDLDRRHRDLAEGAHPGPVAHRRLVRHQDQGCDPRYSGVDQARYLLREPESFASFQIGRASCRARVCQYV